MKAIIDWVTAGRVRIGGDIHIDVVSVTEGAKINSDGTLGTAASTGAHVREFSVDGDGATCTATYYMPNATGSLCVAYYNASGTLLGGIASGTGSNKGRINTTVVTLPTGTRTVRVFSIRASTASAEAALVLEDSNNIYEMEEIRVRATGDAVSQVVWPTTLTYRIVAGTAHVIFSSGSILSPMGNNYAQVVADIEVLRGSSVINTLHNQVMEPVFASGVPYVTIGGVSQPAATIVSDTEIHAPNFRTTEFSGYTFYVRGTYAGLATDRLSVYIGANAEHFLRWTNDTVKGYRIAVDDDELSYSGGTVHVSGYVQKEHTPYNWWDSGEHTYGAPVPYETSQAPTAITVSPNTGVSISGTAITFPANTTTDEKSYTISATWSSYTRVAYVRVQGTSTGRTYSNLAIQSYTYPTYGSGSNAYSIPAGGGGVYPTITVRVYCSVNGDTAKLLSGTATGGALICEVSGGGINATVSLSYLDYTNGYVSASSRGTNEDADRTLVASSIRVRASIGSLSVTSTYSSIYQQRNEKWIASGDEGNYQVTSFSVTPKLNGSALPTSGSAYTIDTANITQIALDFRVSGSGRTDKYTYTALDENGNHVTSGGEVTTNTNTKVEASSLTNLSVRDQDNVSLTVTDLQFNADNRHFLSQRTYTVSARYGSTSSTATATIVQVADEKIAVGETPFVFIAEVDNSNSIWAGGGTADFVVTAYSTSGTRWKSDGSIADSTTTPVDNTDAILLSPVASSSAAYPLIQLIATDTARHTKTFRVSHRDMTTNVTTDTLSVSASNGSAQTQTPLSYSVQNALLDTIYTVDDDTVIWGEETERDVSYRAAIAIRRAGGTADPTLFTRDYPALFIGDSAEYIASAAHTHQVIQRGAARRYSYKHYSSWSSAHDDDNHRFLVNTEEINPQTRLIDAETIMDGVSVSTNVSWITLNTSTGAFTISAQPEEGRVRYGNLVATNTSDPASTQATGSREIVQNAWANLTASPLVPPTFDWEGGSTEITITARYTMFTIASTGDWISLAIKPYLADDSQYETPSGSYGNTGGSQQYTLKVSATINDEDHNPTGYTHVRIAGVTLTPEYPGISTVRIRLEQEAYDGGLPTNE